jgi:hypothetical protein
MKAKLLLLPILIATGANADVLMPTENSAKYADNRVRLTAKLQEPPKPIAPKMVSSDLSGKAGTSNVQPQKSSSAKTISITPDKGAVPVNSAVATGLAEKQEKAPAVKKTSADLPIKELNEEIQVSFRDRSLPSSIRTLTPPGWVLDLQIDKSIETTLISFSGETSYAQALKDILEPQGLTYLAYRNMKPKPLIVVTHGGKK